MKDRLLAVFFMGNKGKRLAFYIRSVGTPVPGCPKRSYKKRTPREGCP